MRWIGMALACGGLCGCSSSTYDAAYSVRTQDYRVASEFSRLRPESTAFADGLADVRLPTVLKDQRDGTDPEKPAKPPFIGDFPGFASAYADEFAKDDATFPVLLTVGVVPTADRPKDQVAAAILRQVRQDEEFGKATWQKARKVVDASGVERSWDVLELDGPQLFLVHRAGAAEEKRLPGRTEVWLSADPKQKASVILAWRVPEPAAAHLPLPDLSTLTARAVHVAEP